MLERRDAGDVLVQDVVPTHLGRQCPQLLDGGVQVAGGPQHRGVEDQAERAGLVLLPGPVRLRDLSAPAVANVPGELVAGLPDGELTVHLAPVGVVRRIDHPQQVQGLGDSPVLGERGAQRGGTALAAEHPQQVVGTDLSGHQEPATRSMSGQCVTTLPRLTRLRASGSSGP